MRMSVAVMRGNVRRGCMMHARHMYVKYRIPEFLANGTRREADKSRRNIGI